MANDGTARAATSPSWKTGVQQLRWPIVLRSPLVLALAAYVILTLILYPNYMSFHYKDEIVFVTVAERYARVDFAIAPNALWSPLISWLMAPALSLGASSIVTARTISIILGAVTLWSARRLAKTMSIPDGIQLVYLLTLVPYLVYYALFSVTGDLPLTALLVFYFSVIIDPRYPDRRYSGIICGFLGGLSYYAKGYALGFFLIHFAVVSALHWIAHRDAETRKRVVRHAAGGIAVFAALAAIWVAALHQKYGVVTIGITGQYNHEIKGPEAKDRPALHIGFVEPPEATTVSIWEDPAYFYGLPQARACCLKPWSPFDSPAAFKHQLLLFESNLGRTLTIFLSYSPLTLAVGFAALMYCFAPFWPTNRRKKISPPTKSWRTRLDQSLADVRHALIEKKRLLPALILLTISIYPIPYMLIFSDERYLWPVLIVVMGLGFYLLHMFSSEYTLARSAKAWLTGVFAVSFLLFPVYKLSTGHKARGATTSVALQLEGADLSGARFASNTDYGASMVVGYHIGAKYYGSAAPGMSDLEIAEDLKRQGIQYYFVWGSPAVERPGMTLSRLVKADFRTLAIYEVKP